VLVTGILIAAPLRFKDVKSHVFLHSIRFVKCNNDESLNIFPVSIVNCD
jgi:hypothetical protein